MKIIIVTVISTILVMLLIDEDIVRSTPVKYNFILLLTLDLLYASRKNPPFDQMSQNILNIHWKKLMLIIFYSAMSLVLNFSDLCLK